MSERIDTKFKITAYCEEHEDYHNDRDAVLFLCKDRAFLPTLRYYRNICVQIGAGERQILAVDQLIGRVERWQAIHPDMMKVPDVDDGPKGDKVLGL